MTTKELITGLKEMYEWLENYGFDFEVFVKHAPNSKCADGRKVIDEIIKRLKEYEELRKEIDSFKNLMYDSSR